MEIKKIYAFEISIESEGDLRAMCPELVKIVSPEVVKSLQGGNVTELKDSLMGETWGYLYPNKITDGSIYCLLFSESDKPVKWDEDNCTFVGENGEEVGAVDDWIISWKEVVYISE